MVPVPPRLATDTPPGYTLTDRERRPANRPVITARTNQSRLRPRRQPYQKDRVSDQVRRIYRCPRCGQAHHRDECLANVTDLDPAILANLRTRVLEEIGRSLLDDAPRDHLDGILRVLRGIEARLSREQDTPPTVQRRQQLADIGASPGPSGRPS